MTCFSLSSLDYLHMKRVGENGEDGDEIDEDNLYDGPPVLCLVDHSASAGHGVESVQGDGSQAECRDINRDSLQIINLQVLVILVYVRRQIY